MYNKQQSVVHVIMQITFFPPHLYFNHSGISTNMQHNGYSKPRRHFSTAKPSNFVITCGHRLKIKIINSQLLNSIAGFHYCAHLTVFQIYICKPGTKARAHEKLSVMKLKCTLYHLQPMLEDWLKACCWFQQTGMEWLHSYFEMKKNMIKKNA